MLREMRKKERSINISEAIEILNKGQYGILSVITNEGYPYGVPINYVYMNNCIYFHCAMEGHKLDSTKLNNNVSFCVVGKTELLPNKFSTKYESVIVFGKAFEVLNEEKITALSAFVDKYSKEFKDAGDKYIKNSNNRTKVIKINIEHISGKARR